MAVVRCRCWTASIRSKAAVARSLNRDHARARDERGGSRRSLTDETVPPVAAEFVSKQMTIVVVHREIGQRRGTAPVDRVVLMPPPFEAERVLGHLPAGR